MMLQYIAAVVLIAHGLGHSIYVISSWGGIDPGFRDNGWILPGGFLIDSTVGKAWALLWIAALVIFIGAGVGILMDEGWWRVCALIGSAVSIAAILPWTRTVVAGALAGAALDHAIILVLLLPWGEKVTDFFKVP